MLETGLATFWTVTVGCVMARAIGLLALRGLRVDAVSETERIVTANALGLGIMAYVILGSGLAGHLKLGILGAVLIGLGSLLVVGVGKYRGRNFTTTTPGLPNPRAVMWSLLGLVVVAGLLTWVGSMAPPAADDWDSLAYHLADPKVYLQHDRVIPLWYESHSNFPMTMDMLYAMGLAGPGGAAAAKGFHWLAYLLAIGATYMLARRFSFGSDPPPAPALFAALIFATVPMVLWEATSAYIDIGTALFLTLMVYAGLLWRQKREIQYAVLSGIFAGLAMGTKYTAILYAVVWGLILLFDGLKEWIGGRKTIGNVAVYGLVAIAVASPWYVKSYVWTRNPVYPFFYTVFDGRNWNEHNAEVYEQSQKAFGMGRGVDKLILSPINLTIFPSAFNDRMSTDWRIIYLFSVGPIFLMAVPCLLAARRAPRDLWYLIALLAVAWIAWFIQMQYARYLIALAPLASVVAGWLIWHLWERFRGLSVVPVAATVLVGVFNIGLFAMLIAVPRIPAVFGLQSRQDYLTQNLGGLYLVSEYINQNLPKDAKVIMYQEVRGFYIDREYLWGNPEHHDMIPYATFKSPADLIAGLRKQGVTHILTFDPAMPPYDQARGWVTLLYDADLEGRLERVYSDRGYTLMAIR